MLIRPASPARRKLCRELSRRHLGTRESVESICNTPSGLPDYQPICHRSVIGRVYFIRPGRWAFSSPCKVLLREMVLAVPGGDHSERIRRKLLFEIPDTVGRQVVFKGKWADVLNFVRQEDIMTIQLDGPSEEANDESTGLTLTEEHRNIRVIIHRYVPEKQVVLYTSVDTAAVHSLTGRTAEHFCPKWRNSGLQCLAEAPIMGNRGSSTLESLESALLEHVRGSGGHTPSAPPVSRPAARRMVSLDCLSEQQMRTHHQPGLDHSPAARDCHLKKSKSVCSPSSAINIRLRNPQGSAEGKCNGVPDAVVDTEVPGSVNRGNGWGPVIDLSEAEDESLEDELQVFCERLQQTIPALQVNDVPWSKPKERVPPPGDLRPGPAGRSSFAYSRNSAPHRLSSRSREGQSALRAADTPDSRMDPVEPNCSVEQDSSWGSCHGGSGQRNWPHASMSEISKGNMAFLREPGTRMRCAVNYAPGGKSLLLQQREGGPTVPPEDPGYSTVKTAPARRGAECPSATHRERLLGAPSSDHSTEAAPCLPAEPEVLYQFTSQATALFYPEIYPDRVEVMEERGDAVTQLHSTSVSTVVASHRAYNSSIRWSTPDEVHQPGAHTLRGQARVAPAAPPRNHSAPKSGPSRHLVGQVTAPYGSYAFFSSAAVRPQLQGPEHPPWQPMGSSYDSTASRTTGSVYR
ncbi:hypothetical protein CSUI_003827 [Cystoisospora suis]|uniref:Uncharacterized protein n=1 Tax=Cystoisospora suis TaxID=483139 RepID=A0A2C6L2S9_9APIC|nr:hypothetical protein CSUI_003827 [Cystoisospora suis]